MPFPLRDLQCSHQGSYFTLYQQTLLTQTPITPFAEGVMITLTVSRVVQAARPLIGSIATGLSPLMMTVCLFSDLFKRWLTNCICLGLLRHVRPHHLDRDDPVMSTPCAPTTIKHPRNDPILTFTFFV